MIATPAQAYPSESFMDCAAKYLVSRDGEPGLNALSERVAASWDDLVAAWPEVGDGGWLKFGKVLLKTARSCDRTDLAGREISLRSVRGNNLKGLVDSGTDLNTCAQLMRVLVELLARGDGTKIFEAVSGISSSGGSLVLGDQAFLANLVLIQLLLEKGEFDQAIATAKKNLAVGSCPTSQFMLYRSLRAKRDSGAAVPESEICLDDLSERFCSEPFDSLATGSSARKSEPPHFFACQCPGTLPYPVSNNDAPLTFDTLWNGPEIQEIRRSILDGDFTYCSRMMCPKLTEKLLPKRSEVTDPRLRDIIENRRTKLSTRPIKLSLGHDPSCNLACPSCRNELIFIKNEERERLDKLSEEILLPLMERTKLSLIICTDGDPIGSRHYRKLIHSLDPERHGQVRLMLITNGLLLTEREWDAMEHVQPMVAFVGVSIDASRADTYEDLRRPGKWATITANMDFLSRLRADGRLRHLGLQFVVQQKNLEEMTEFVELGIKWNADTIRFIRLLNNGSYSGDDFEESDVSDPRHPLHPRLLEILRNPIFRDPRVSMFTLQPLWEEANSPAGAPGGDWLLQ